MAIEFIDSESCEVDGEKMLYFREPRQLRDKIIETIKTVGAEKFFSSTDESVKKVRESMAEFFFMLGLKRDSGQDWFLMQPKGDPPDFVLMTARDNPIEITIDEFELVEIPGRCKTYEDMMSIVQGKLNKGYPENCYHLLIFMNSENSREWVNLLNRNLRDYKPFKTVWTVHLLWDKNKKNIYSCVVNRLRPMPVRHIETPLSDDGLGQSQNLPIFMEELTLEGKRFINLKADFARELTKEIRKMNLRKSKMNSVDGK